MRFLTVLAVIWPAATFAAAQPAPDDALTPGAVRPGSPLAPRPHVPAAVARAVARAYGVSGIYDPSCGSRPCELDHRIPWRCLGATTFRNLSFQSFPYWVAKDRLEHWAERQVALGHLSLTDCQEMFRAPNDWRVRYRIIYGEAP